MKDHPMTKDEVAWLLIRAAGIAFGWMALKKISGFFFAAYLFTSIGWRELRESPSNMVSWQLALPQALAFIIYAAIATYLLRGGSALHRILTSGHRHANPPRSTMEDNAPVASFDELP